jgi:hypothetical protein
MGGHTARHARHWVLTTTLLRLKALVVGHLLLLLLGHIIWVHASSTRDSRLLAGDWVLRNIFGRIRHVCPVDTVFVASRFRSVQACLEKELVSTVATESDIVGILG